MRRCRQHNRETEIPEMEHRRPKKQTKTSPWVSRTPTRRIHPLWGEPPRRSPARVRTRPVSRTPDARPTPRRTRPPAHTSRITSSPATSRYSPRSDSDVVQGFVAHPAPISSDLPRGAAEGLSWAPDGEVVTQPPCAVRGWQRRSACGDQTGERAGEHHGS